jgi:mRNA-degrading endonuclease toxin of MazEF toxin-antitoxin module
VVWADPDPTRGAEQAKPRPFIVVSVDHVNRSPLRLSLVSGHEKLPVGGH